jgi:hypothetical protein
MARLSRGSLLWLLCQPVLCCARASNIVTGCCAKECKKRRTAVRTWIAKRGGQWWQRSGPGAWIVRVGIQVSAGVHELPRHALLLVNIQTFVTCGPPSRSRSVPGFLFRSCAWASTMNADTLHHNLSNGQPWVSLVSSTR